MMMMMTLYDAAEMMLMMSRWGQVKSYAMVRALWSPYVSAVLLPEAAATDAEGLLLTILCGFCGWHSRRPSILTPSVQASAKSENMEQRYYPRPLQ